MKSVKLDFVSPDQIKSELVRLHNRITFFFKNNIFKSITNTRNAHAAVVSFSFKNDTTSPSPILKLVRNAIQKELALFKECCAPHIASTIFRKAILA